MKKLFYYLMLFPLAGIAQQSPATAGKYMGQGELSGNPYVLGSSSAVNVVMNSVAAYNANDVVTTGMGTVIGTAR
jgi:hypothetical protein